MRVLTLIRDVAILALVVFLAAWLSTPARADTVTFTWTAPTQREDGTALASSEIAGYRLAWTLAGVAQTDKVLPPGTSYALDTGTLAGRVCATLRTIDTDGLESAPTGEVCRKAKPNPPTNMRAK